MDNDDAKRRMYIGIARVVGIEMGTCTRRNVGAVLVSGGRPREIGWNGMERAAGEPTCQGGSCPRGQLSEDEQAPGIGYSNCIYLHAEFNAWENFRHSQRARNVEGWALSIGVTIYSSSIPCSDCTDYCRWAGIELIWEGM